MKQHRTTLAALALAVFALPSALPDSASAQDTEGEPATAGIDIDIRGGARRELIPIAVPDLLVKGGADATASEAYRIMARDLELAGYFKILPKGTYLADPKASGLETASINFDSWRNITAQALIKGQITKTGDTVKVDLRLYIVDKGQRAKIDFSAASVPADEVPGVVHSFVNAVVGYYTGDPGVFGQQIAFVRRNKAGLKQIYVTDVSGTSSRAITRNNSINLLPSWGNGRVFYTSYQQRNPDLWVYEGGKHRKLSSQRGQNSGAAYCGGKVALTLSMGGRNTDIYLIDPSSGKKLQRLTDHWEIDTSPTWSPDCSKIAFVSGRASSPQIYVMNADGSKQRRLTFKGNYNTSPDWSPKGDVIAFTSRDERDAFDIFTVDLNGQIERLTQDQGNNEEPSWSPDGRYLVFASDRQVGNRRKRIWLMTADGQYQRLITERGSGYESPSWQR